MKEKNTFSLVSLPFCTLDHRYFTAAYIGGIVQRSGWNFHYLDLNLSIYSAQPANKHQKIDWGAEKQIQLFDETKSIGRETIFFALKKEIARFHPDILGISLMNSNRLYSQLVLEILNELDISTPVIFGGPDCFPREHHINYFRMPFVPSIMLQGEAEIALPLFLHEFSLTKNIQTQIKGFIYQSNGKMIDTGLPELSYLKSETLPSDYEVFDFTNEQYVHDDMVFTFCSKGCINKCAFCSESRNYQPYRRRKAAEVINEVEENLSKLPTQDRCSAKVMFRDSIFNASLRYVQEICELILQKGLNIQWYCMAGFRVALTDEILDLMSRSGCINIFYGFESASQRVIDLMGKNFDIRVAQETIKKCVEHGISVALPIINGFPGECTRDFLTSMAFILKYRNIVDFNYSNTCGIFKQTPLSDFPKDFYLGKVDQVQYELIDGYNIFPVRQLRQGINDALIKREPFSESEVLQSLDFNILPVAAELAQIIHFQSTYLKRWSRDKEFLANWSSMAIPDVEIVHSNTHLEDIIPNIRLTSWLSQDKNKNDSKNTILSLLNELALDFEEKILEREVNFYDFRNSLYNFQEAKLSRNIPTNFNISLEYFSEYDKGMHLIFEGEYIYESGQERKVSRIESMVGNYCFDIHHTINTEKEGIKGLKFWGKINKSMLQKNPLITKILFNDGTSTCFRLPINSIVFEKPKYFRAMRNRVKGLFRKAKN